MNSLHAASASIITTAQPGSIRCATAHAMGSCPIAFLTQPKFDTLLEDGLKTTTISTTNEIVVMTELL